MLWSSQAPNNSGPSYSGYVSNVISGISQGGINVGDQNVTPEGFEIVTSFNPEELIVTPSENSWEGDFSPTGNFAGELGSRAVFVVLVMKDTSDTFVNLQNFVFNYESEDNLLNFTADYSTLSYNGTTRGAINYGGNGVLGGGDDTYVNSGSANSDAAWFIIANGYSATQANFSSTVTYVAENTGFVKGTGTYTGSGTDSNSLTTTVIPEPSTWLLLSLSLGSLCLLRRKRI